jgi:hypothetical protein
MNRAEILVADFLANFLDPDDWPNPQLGEAPIQEVLQMFFEVAPLYKAEAEKRGMVWNAAAVDEVDLLLQNISETGTYDLRVSLTPEGAVEWWRRWKFVLALLTVETKRQPKLTYPMRTDIPDNAQGMAMVLYFMFEPGRHYPEGLYVER